MRIRVLLLFTIVFPILIFQSFLMNFLYGVTANIDNYAFADFVNAFPTLLFLLIAQIPFIQFTQSDQEGRDNPVKDAYMFFLNRGFSMYLFAIVFAMGFVELVIELVSLFGTSLVTTNYPTILLTQMLLNVVFFPFIVMITYVLDWKEKIKI